MSLDDIKYASCLLASVGSGYFIVKVNNADYRKMLCTIIGMIMVFAFSGFGSMYCYMSALLGYLPIRLKARWCHIVTFIVMFSSLALFRLLDYFRYMTSTGHTNMIQMILTLKVVGLALEKSAACKTIADIKEIDDNIGYRKSIEHVSVIEFFHYCFNYIGVLTGPYYRYRTYYDYFETSFYKFAPRSKLTIEKLCWAILYCAAYLLAAYVWPIEYAQSSDFYNERSAFYRLFYMWPLFFVFRMRIYTGLTLSECVCTMAGFGAYPDNSDATNGQGPQKPYMNLLKHADKQTYNFTTITNTRMWEVERCCTFRETMKQWNVCVQYWLAVNIYKQFPSKKFRMLATLLCSAFWHGFRPGHYLCLMGAPFYCPVEDKWNELIRKNASGNLRKGLDIIFWFSKWFTLSYLGTAFILNSFGQIWRYYSSVYHFGYVLWAIFSTTGIIFSRFVLTEVK